jgi:hypothetical protein
VCAQVKFLYVAFNRLIISFLQAFIEFETPQEAVRAMEKDRAKFGPEYGDRFCMLQLVGRHEMDKVTLQKESDTTSTKLLVSASLPQVSTQT